MERVELPLRKGRALIDDRATPRARMRVETWQGFHSPELEGRIRAAWEGEHLLVLCPPLLHDFSFLETLERTEWPIGRPDARTERPVLGVFTSGTTSPAPRLVLYTRANLDASLDAILAVFDEQRIDSIFAYPQPFHTFGLTLAYLHAFRRGKQLIAPAGRYTQKFHDDWLRAASENPGMLTLGTPTHFQDLRRFVATAGARPAPTYTAIIGGAPCTRALWKGLRDELAIEAPSIGYGCTEAAPGLTHLAPGVEPAHDAEIGHVLRGVSLNLIPGKGLEFDGPNRCFAIVHAGAITHPTRVLVKDHLERDSRGGSLRFVGRYDLQINRGGVKFSLERIESIVRERFDRESIAVALPDERLGEDLGLLIADPEGAEDSMSAPFAAELARELLTEFGAHFDSAKFRSARALPLNASAKLDRSRAREMIAR